jgi:hypothetical protein
VSCAPGVGGALGAVSVLEHRAPAQPMWLPTGGVPGAGQMPRAPRVIDGGAGGGDGGSHAALVCAPDGVVVCGGFAWFDGAGGARRRAALRGAWARGPPGS